MTSFFLGNDTTEVSAEGNTFLVTSNFEFQGDSSVVGAFSGKAIGQDSYVRSGESWLISNETLNFTSYQEQFAVVT